MNGRDKCVVEDMGGEQMDKCVGVKMWGMNQKSMWDRVDWESFVFILFFLRQRGLKKKGF